MKARWQTKPFGEVLQKTETVNPQQSPQREFEYIDVSSVSNATFQIGATQRLMGKDAPSRARKLVRANDVLFATIRPTLQRIAVVPEWLDGQVCSTGYFVLRPRPEINHRYLFYSLFTKNFTRQMESLQKGASYPAVTDGDVKAQIISFPSLSEQHRIVALLDKAFDGIATAKANAEKNLQNARALFESHLQSVFTERGEGWVEKPLGAVCEVKDGTHDSPKYVDEGIPFVTQKNIREDGLSLEKTKFILQEDHDNFYRRSNAACGDILISMIGANRGMACIVDEEQIFSIKNVGLVKQNPAVDQRFLLYFLKSPQAARHVQSVSKGGAQEFVGLTELRKFPVPVPSLELQNLLGERFQSLRDETQRLESLYRQKLAALDDLKKSLLHQAFSGQL
ncbi:restriction endonuclease subunit S [Denitromonas ohlonensis]|uniref:Restriction endonuclease subunit S n=2 Tax=Denitromonas TaxID=139331 RepID=A0A557R5W6_9RHOO|nr:restriction endonuclease subunit S [Denitromonas ohlonensis]TVO60553.1 restriction endonuclease subunit S [Denitromonas ohlonensis]TVO72283.1 restriction endonuclease subunit S [Denitromonas ohlonensis]